MAIRKKSNAGLWASLLLVFFLMGGLFYLFSNMNFTGSSSAVNDLKEENAALKEELSAQNSVTRWAAIRSILFWLGGFSLAGFVAWLFFRNKQGEKYALTISEVKKRVSVLCRDELMLGSPEWIEVTTKELKNGRLYYFVVIGFVSKVWGRVQNWHRVKIIGVDPLDWDRGRMEDIPMGLSLDEYFKGVFHKRNSFGAVLVRGVDEDAEEFAVHIAQKRKKTDEIIESIGG